jgi:hypothetical protein
MTEDSPPPPAPVADELAAARDRREELAGYAREVAVLKVQRPAPFEPFYDEDDDLPASEVASAMTPAAAAMLSRYQTSPASDRPHLLQQSLDRQFAVLQQITAFDNMRIAVGNEPRLEIGERWEMEQEPGNLKAKLKARKAAEQQEERPLELHAQEKKP